MNTVSSNGEYLEPIPLGYFIRHFGTGQCSKSSGFCALAGPKLASTITPGGIGSYPEMMLCEEFISHINQFEGGKARPSH
ncbi:Uncharacterised protein [Salmonella enterica subsp. enterica]|nr:Uncharacterised protein [Salmonella enterica subsp. enterica]